MDRSKQRRAPLVGDSYHTKLTREKPSGSGTCFRTASAFVLKDASIGQIITEKRYDYATDSCSQAPTTNYVAYHYDHIGNVVALTDCDGLGTFRTAYDMDAFGNVTQGDQDGIHLTGKEYDPDSGLYYFGARWYDPHTGKWVEKEPSGSDGPNLYNFVFNHPVSSYDYNGLELHDLILPLCMQDIAKEVNDNYDGGDGGDRFKHCLVSCRAMQECFHLPNPRGTFFWGVVHEIIGRFGSDSIRDIGANSYGIKCGAIPGNGCHQCCACKYSAINR